LQRIPETAGIMTDVYVYRFIGRDGPMKPEPNPRRRATLDTIKAYGDPIMDSQVVVDDGELDSEGFFYESVANDPNSGMSATSEIKSLNLRAASRDAEALDLDGEAGAQKYMLHLESRELRKQAQKLQKQYEFAAAESDNAADCGQCGGSPTAG
jgi:hypothetical protein